MTLTATENSGEWCPAWNGYVRFSWCRGGKSQQQPIFLTIGTKVTIFS